jgi:hypothetical protein
MTVLAPVKGFADTLSNELLVCAMVRELRQFQCSHTLEIARSALRRCGQFTDDQIEAFAPEAARVIGIERAANISPRTP